MNPLLTGLGVPAEVQAFFQISEELLFSYGDVQEHFNCDLHKIPTTQNIWMAGEFTASEVIITYCAMEAIAFLTTNFSRCPNLSGLAFVAIGNKLQQAQIKWIRETFPNRKFTMVFGNDPLALITDIKLAAGLKNVPVKIQHSNSKLLIRCGNVLRVFDEDKISFYAFQTAFGIRGKIRTRKPNGTLTFLDQLKNDAYR
jgi:hypothetical protein